MASFTVPLDGCTIVATTSVATTFSSSAVCPGSAAPWCCENVCVAMSCGGGFTPGGAYDSIWDSVMPMTGIFHLVPVSCFLRVCMHAELLVQQLCGPYVLRGCLRCDVVWW